MGTRKKRKTCEFRPFPGRDLGVPGYELLNTRKVCTLLEHDFRDVNAVVLIDIKRRSGKRLRTSTLKESPVAFPCSY